MNQLRDVASYDAKRTGDLEAQAGSQTCAHWKRGAPERLPGRVQTGRSLMLPFREIRGGSDF